jgi:hypothetical protein
MEEIAMSTSAVQPSDKVLIELGRKAAALEAAIENTPDDEDYDDLTDERDEIGERIFATRARTLAGFIVKVHRMLWWRSDRDRFGHELEHPEDIAFAVSIARDLLAIEA